MAKQRTRTLAGAVLLSGAMLIGVPAGMASADPLNRILHGLTHGSVAELLGHRPAVARGGLSDTRHTERTVLRQNTPAIQATEFDYVEMWAQDVGAMLG